MLGAGTWRNSQQGEHGATHGELGTTGRGDPKTSCGLSLSVTLITWEYQEFEEFPEDTISQGMGGEALRNLDEIPDSLVREMNPSEDKCEEQRFQRGEQSNFLSRRGLRAHLRHPNEGQPRIGAPSPAGTPSSEWIMPELKLGFAKSAGKLLKPALNRNNYRWLQGRWEPRAGAGREDPGARGPHSCRDIVWRRRLLFHRDAFNQDLNFGLFPAHLALNFSREPCGLCFLSPGLSQTTKHRAGAAG